MNQKLQDGQKIYKVSGDRHIECIHIAKVFSCGKIRTQFSQTRIRRDGEAYVSYKKNHDMDDLFLTKEKALIHVEERFNAHKRSRIVEQESRIRNATRLLAKYKEETFKAVFHGRDE